jgi:hypothetical protein
MDRLSDPHYLAVTPQRMHRKEKMSGTASPWRRREGARQARTEREIRSGPNLALEPPAQGGYQSTSVQLPHALCLAAGEAHPLDAPGLPGRLPGEVTQAARAPHLSATAAAPLRGRGHGIRSASVRTGVKDVGSSSVLVTKTQATGASMAAVSTDVVWPSSVPGSGVLPGWAGCWRPSA